LDIRFATNADIPQLKNIWKTCFGDSDSYIDLFFAHLFVPEQTIVACDKSLPIGVVYTLRAELDNKEFRYGYAIGVLPEYRGKNVCKAMLDTIRQQAEKEGFLFGLHPANKKLFSFYKKIGLTEMFQLKIVDASHYTNKQPLILEDVSAEEYFTLRKQSFKLLVSWDKNMISYMIKETHATGGFVHKIQLDTNSRILLGKVLGDTIFIKETTLNDDEIKAVSQGLMQHFSANKILYYLPASSKLCGTEETMILGFENQDTDVYMNLFLD